MSSGHLASHIRRMRAIYRERAMLLIDCLRTELPRNFTVPNLEAGLHLTLESPEPIDDSSISDELLRHRIDVAALSSYYSAKPRSTGFVVGFGNTPKEQIRLAVSKFAEIVKTRMPRH